MLFCIRLQKSHSDTDGGSWSNIKTVLKLDVKLNSKKNVKQRQQ